MPRCGNPGVNRCGKGGDRLPGVQIKRSRMDAYVADKPGVRRQA